MWSLVGIVCLLLGIVVQFSIDIRPAEAARDDISLRVSVRRDALQGVSSCVLTHSQVELLNLDPSEPTVVHSITTTPEEVIQVKNGEHFRVNVEVPQQILVSKIDGGSLTLGPKQIAIVPMTFLPRFPELPGSSPIQNQQPHLSKAAHTDLADLVGHENLYRHSKQRRSNLGYESNDDQFEVHTTIVLDTSRGLLKLPIVASSTRENGFRLPDVIRFRDDRVQPSESPKIIGQEDDNSGSPDDCFDLHISNPSPVGFMELHEIFLSRPDLIKLYYNDDVVSDKILSEMFVEWKDGSQRSVFPGAHDDYVMTICPRKLSETSNITETGELSGGLGYIQIRTGVETLIVSLDLSTEQDEKVVGVVGDPSVKASSLTAHVEHTADSSNTRLITKPKEIEVQLFLPSQSLTAVTTINVQKHEPYPVKIMRTSLVNHFANDTFLSEMARELGLTLEVQLGERGNANVNENTELSYIENSIDLICSISATSTLDSLGLYQPLRFTGLIVARASSAIDASYSEWRDVMKNDPYKDSHLTMEIPYVVTVVDRRLHVMVKKSSGVPSDTLSRWRYEKPLTSNVSSVESLFFPLRRDMGQLREHGSTASSRHLDKDLSFELRIVSPVYARLTRAALQEAPQSELCGRFKLSALRTTPISGQVDNSSFYDLGTMTLIYSFDEVPETRDKKSLNGQVSGVTVDDGIVMPQTCYLLIPTNTVALRIPLIIFPGKLDVTSSEFTIGQEDYLPNKQSNATVHEAFAASITTGLPHLLKWLGSSGMGGALLEVLKVGHGGRESVLTDSKRTMLVEYLSLLCSRTSAPDASLLPILVDLGAVVHGEVRTSSIFLTNHNPVPIKVSVDVGEVEGMSIALARDFSRGKGDGNSIWDRLPGLNYTRDMKITSGRWKGHSRRGLHSFLLSSEFARAFSTSLQYRDAVSLSSVAARSQPILQKLYEQGDAPTFYSDPVAPHLLSTDGSICPGLDLNPPEFEKEGRTDRSFSGPIMLSKSLSVSRHLNVCRDSEEHEMQHQPVFIPPGGVARFEVKIRCPPKKALQNDITPFMGTGLVLSTDHGQIFPIIATFEALLGHLQVSRLPSTVAGAAASAEDETRENAIEVPLGLFATTSDREGIIDTDGLLIKPNGGTKEPTAARQLPANVSLGGNENASVPLFVTSSFSREVTLKHVESCNPWFEVRLSERILRSETSSVNKTDDIEIGTINSVIPCKPFHYNGGSEDFSVDLPGRVPEYPSFYECALDWLQKRFTLQPRGCGLSPSPVEGWSESEKKENKREILAIESLRQAVHYSLFKFNDATPRGDATSSNDDLGGTQEEPVVNSTSIGLENELSMEEKQMESSPTRDSPFVEQIAVDLFAQVTDHWRLITESELNVMSSNLRAQIEYSHSKENVTDHKSRESQTLSVAMHGIAIRSSLEIPKLFDPIETSDTLFERSADSGLSVLDFLPTRIADLRAMMVPVRNPTGVPVRVRLSSPGKPAPNVEDDEDIYEEIGFSPLQTDARDRFLQHYDPVYIQHGRARDHLNDPQPWWEGPGAFFIQDDTGELLQARYNLSLTAGSGAQISLLNPSLHSTTAFAVGCGARCGVREDSTPFAAVAGQGGRPPMKEISPIGASSAAGTVLLGGAQSRKDPAERCIAAGGSTPADSAQLAFAIPYTALDEIILPPYGSGELGPVLFRPPGRFSMLGCDAVLESHVSPRASLVSKACASSMFESLLFLENSLTGLERVVMRGKAFSPRVVFLDPSRENSPYDVPGDLEHKYGRATLVFSGSMEPQKGAITKLPQRTVKEFMVKNDGDIAIQFDRVFFSQASAVRLGSVAPYRSGARRKENSGVPGRSGCGMHGFRLHSCWDDNDPSERVDSSQNNLRRGFTLQPGQSLSLFVEHFPDCAHSTEYVALNFRYHGDETANKGNETNWTTGSSRSRYWSGTVRETESNMQLLIGFEMSQEEMSTCIPSGSISEPRVVAGSESEGKLCPTFLASTYNVTSDSPCFLPEEQRIHFGQWSIFPGRLILLCSSAFMIWRVIEEHVSRRRASLCFQSNLRGVKTTVDRSKRSQSVENSFPSSDTNHWLAAFRCLARADPLSAELQALGREQARQLVQTRYKTTGGVSPHCISSSGVFIRDRSGVANGGNRGGGVLSGGEKKILTLSDAIFKGTFIDQAGLPEGSRLVPCSLGWREAVSKGIIGKSSMPDVALKSKELLRKNKETCGEASLSRQTSQDQSGHVSTKIERSMVQEYEEVKVDHYSSRTSAATSEIDESKGDVVSTSESEGTAEAPKNAESVSEPCSPGFSKVARQKSKSSTNNKSKMERSKWKTPQGLPVGVSSPMTNKRTTAMPAKKSVTSPQPTREKVPSTSQPLTNKRAEKNTVSVVAPSKPKGKKAPDTLPSKTQSAPRKESSKLGAIGSPRVSKNSRSTPSSVQSSPSSVGQVSVSSRSTSKSDDRRSGHGIRPPPGLAPPPGFGAVGEGSASSIPAQKEYRSPHISSKEPLLPVLPTLNQGELASAFDSSVGNTSFSGASSPVPSTDGIDLPRSSPSLFPTVSRDDSFNEPRPISSPSPLVSPPKPQRTSHSREQNSGFDVMDFLDNILEEHRSSEPDEEGLGDLLEENTSGNIVPGLHVSSDPWATERKSRAAAYGINVEDDDDEEEDIADDIVYAILASSAANRTNGESSSSSLQNSVPLLTPSAMLLANDDPPEMDEHDNDTPTFKTGGSFYSSLLGE